MTFLLGATEHWQLFLPIGIIGAISWGVWLLRKILSARLADLLILAPVRFVIMLVALPVRTWAFVTMTQPGPLPRSAGRLGDAGQNHAGLTTGGSRGHC